METEEKLSNDLNKLALTADLSDSEYEQWVRKITIGILNSAPNAIQEKIAKFENYFSKLDVPNCRKHLRDMLTTLQFDLPEELNQTMDAVSNWKLIPLLLSLILRYEISQNPEAIVDALSLPRLYDGCRVAVWRGDITTLKIDAIVNAANKYMLGCFTPSHPCIDNQIHAKAGPRLRTECREIMDKQGHLEETGKAKITKGYCLPSKHVLHTVGPIAAEVGEREDLLASCYSECMRVAKEHGVKSIAFCCISTAKLADQKSPLISSQKQIECKQGVFGYPQEPAAKVAIETVKGLLETTYKDDFDLILFNVWTQKDLKIYTKLLPEYFKAQELTNKE